MPQAGPLNGERGREVSWRNHYLAHTTRKHQFIGDVSPMRHLLKPHQPIACLECNMHHGASERLIRCRLFQFKNSGGRLICLCFQNHIFKNDCFSPCLQFTKMIVLCFVTRLLIPLFGKRGLASHRNRGPTGVYHESTLPKIVHVDNVYKACRRVNVVN